MKTVKTKKGNELPLMNLKGKDYLMVAYRLQWLSDDYDNYTVDTEMVQVTDISAVIRAVVTLLDKEGKVIRKASATKRETQKDFPDFIEKAETGSIGRALAMLGLGTQHAIADLDEGNRLADSPLATPAPKTQVAAVSPSAAGNVTSIASKDASEKSAVQNAAPSRSPSSFKRPATVAVAPVENGKDDWS